MKKIVALVLSLVMALSLCTVAFATTKAHVYEYNKATDKIITTTDAGEVAGWDVETVKAVKNVDGSGMVAHYSLKLDDDFYYIPCEKADATHAIYNNGSFVDWVKVTTDESDAHYCFKADVQKETTALPNCTTTRYLVDGYLDGNGNFYVKAAAADVVDHEDVYAALVDGVIVNVVDANATQVLYASHIFAKGVANDKTGYDVATCLICKGEFACTNDEKVATKNGYKISTGFAYSTYDAGIVYDENAYDNGYDFAWGQTYAGDYKFCWQLKAGTTEEIGATTTTVDTNKGVESAKTFDAGIAMYVGMSLMSVAGTAVVIGKKKEF